MKKIRQILGNLLYEKIDVPHHDKTMDMVDDYTLEEMSNFGAYGLDAETILAISANAHRYALCRTMDGAKNDELYEWFKLTHYYLISQ